MKNLKFKTLIFSTLISLGLSAQDVDMNIVTQENGVNDGNWVIGASNCTVLMTVCNNDGGSVVVPSYKLRPLLSVPGSIVQIAPTAEQTLLPPGWTVLSNNGTSIRLSNGTDNFPPGECREFSIKMIPVNSGGPLNFTATMAFANGVAPGNVSGPQTVGNDAANDNSTTAAIVSGVLSTNGLDFEAAKQGSSVKTWWQVTESASTTRYEVEFSRNAASWETVGTLGVSPSADALKNYSFVHAYPVVGANYYRLKIVSVNGATTYSDTKTVMFSDKGITYQVYPNPVMDKLYINSVDAVIKNIILVDEKGNTLTTLSNFASGKSIDMSRYPAGLYLLKIIDAKGNTEIKKIVKN
ncbi:MAG: T9SS type A sorting domain-containing protein [Pedobacter sp.]|nr:MAG: T9SS type A sorting domain-containing protein [Pedobacter sp.]